MQWVLEGDETEKKTHENVILSCSFLLSNWHDYDDMEIWKETGVLLRENTTTLAYVRKRERGQKGS